MRLPAMTKNFIRVKFFGSTFLSRKVERVPASPRPFYTPNKRVTFSRVMLAICSGVVPRISASAAAV